MVTKTVGHGAWELTGREETASGTLLEITADVLLYPA